MNEKEFIHTASMISTLSPQRRIKLTDPRLGDVLFYVLCAAIEEYIRKHQISDLILELE